MIFHWNLIFHPATCGSGLMSWRLGNDVFSIFKIFFFMVLADLWVHDSITIWWQRRPFWHAIWLDRTYPEKSGCVVNRIEPQVFFWPCFRLFYSKCHFYPTQLSKYNSFASAWKSREGSHLHSTLVGKPWERRLPEHSLLTSRRRALDWNVEFSFVVYRDYIRSRECEVPMQATSRLYVWLPARKKGTPRDWGNSCFQIL